jgi:hypothetical protein
MITEKDFHQASKRLTVIEGDVDYPYIEIGSDDNEWITSFEFFKKEVLQEFIEYLIQVKERWS